MTAPAIPPEAETAAVVAIAQVLARWLHALPPERAQALARECAAEALTAAAPLIAAAERERVLAHLAEDVADRIRAEPPRPVTAPAPEDIAEFRRQLRVHGVTSASLCDHRLGDSPAEALAATLAVIAPRIRAEAAAAERERIRQLADAQAFRDAWKAHKATCAEHGWDIPGISGYRAGWNDLADLIVGDSQ